MVASGELSTEEINIMKTFEEYLQEIHAQDYHGTDDDMPDSFDEWLTDLQVDDVIAYANRWGRTLLGLEPEESFKETYERIRQK